MSATDELRKLLDERGVEYKSHYLNTSWYAGMKLYMATDDMDGTLTVDNLTPEQAIAATLGNSRAERTCKIESSYYYDDYDLYEFEFSCGHSVNMYDKEPTNYCPICGCKVVGE